MLTGLLDDFQSGKTFGVRVLVLPKGAEDREAALVDDVIRGALDERAVVVARDEARVPARESVRNALINGYSAMRGGSGKIAAFVNQQQEAIGGAAADLPGGGLVGLLVKLGIRALTDSPVTALRTPPPYRLDAVSHAIQELCKTHKVVVYVRKAYLDAADSLLFLYQTCGSHLDVMLGEHKRNLLVVFCVREQDLKKDVGRRIEEIAEDSPHLAVVRLKADLAAPSPAASLADMVRAAAPDARALLKRLCVYAAAADANVVPDALIRRAYPERAGESLAWLEKAGVLERVAGDDDATAFWSIADGYDRRDVRAAVRAAWDEEFDAEVGGGDDDGDEAEEGDAAAGAEWRGDEQAADDVFEAVLAVEGETPANAGLLFDLARASASHAAAGARLAGKLVEQLAARGDVAGLAAKLGDVESHLDGEVLGWGDDLEQTEKGWADLVDCVKRMTTALAHLRAEPWGPVQGTIGSLLGRLTEQAWSAIPDGPDGEARRAAEESAGYLLVLTDRGRAKLVPLSEAGLGVRDRRDPSALPPQCVRDVKVDGRASELHAVRRTQMVWLFGTDGQVVALPLRALDAGYGEQPVGITENLGVYLYPAAQWDRFADRVAAVCPYDDPAADAMLRPAYEGAVTWVDPAVTVAFKVAKVKHGRDLAVGDRLRSASGTDFTVRSVFTGDAGDALFAFRGGAGGGDVVLPDADVAEAFQGGDLWFAGHPAAPEAARLGEAGPPADAGTWVLLANEDGLAEVVPVATLPRGAGERVSLGGPLLTRVRPARWAIPVRPGDDLFVATTENRVLRLKADAVVGGPRRVIEALVHLEKGERVAAVAPVPAGSDLSAAVFIVTEGGYGRQVAVSEFPYGPVGGKGVVGQKVGKRSGVLRTIEPVREASHLVVATASGGVVRLPRSEVRSGKRTGVGLRLMGLEDDDRVVCGCTY
jgi:hypothetical protein